MDVGKIKALMVTFILVFALGAVDAAGAAAIKPPRWAVASGVGETFPAALVAETREAVYFEQSGLGRLFTCGAGTLSGQITAPRASTGWKLELSGCLTNSEELHTTGAPQGTIVIKPSESTKETIMPEWLSYSQRTVAIHLWRLGTVRLYSTVGGGQREILDLKGELLVPITPIDALTSTFSLAVNQKRGVQEYSKFEEALGPNSCCVQTEGNFLKMSPAGGQNYLQTGLQMGQMTMYSSKPLEIEG
jgi:hypothetical protein